MRSTTYQPDISERLLRCQFLFETFLRILPSNWPMEQKKVYPLSHGATATIELVFASRYTWRLDFQYTQAGGEAPVVKLEVQVYLDVKLAETVSIDSWPIQVGPPLYPNAQGCYPDEKHQMDNLLLDWLLHIEKTLDE